jgi:hypothetical protein
MAFPLFGVAAYHINRVEVSARGTMRMMGIMGLPLP